MAARSGKEKPQYPALALRLTVNAIACRDYTIENRQSALLCFVIRLAGAVRNLPEGVTN